MKNLIVDIVKAIVDNPSEVELNEVNGEKTLIYELKVKESDVGKVIGKKGRTINSIRTLLKAMTAKEDKKVVLELIQDNSSR